MKKSDEIRNEINMIVAEQVAMNEVIEKDDRSFTGEEQAAYDGLEERYKEQQTKLTEAERAEGIKRRAAEIALGSRSATPAIQTSRKQHRYSLVKAVNGYINRNLDGLEKEIHEELRNEARNSYRSASGLQVPMWAMMSPEKRAITTATDADAVVDQYSGLIEALRDKTVMGSLGATILTGITGGQLVMPKHSAGAAGWVAETADAPDAGDTFGQITLSPERLSAYLDVSESFLNQTAFSAERELSSSLLQSTAEALDKAAINGSGTNNEPLGILGLSGTGTTTFAGAPTWAKIVEMESTTSAANGLRGNVSYLTSPKGLGALKTTAKDAGSGLMLANGMLSSVSPENVQMNGYRTVASNFVPDTLSTDKTGIIFGNFNDVILANWGSLSLTVDNISLAISGQVRLVVSSFWDINFRHQESFTIGLDMDAN